MAQYQFDNVQSDINYQVSDPVLRTLQNCKNLLMTRMGEVPYDHYRGFDSSLFSRPMTDMKTELLKELDRVMLWEPDAEVVSAECSLNSDGTVYIRCVVEIDLDEE